MQIKREIEDAIRGVVLHDGFWGRIVERNGRSTLPHVLKQCEQEGDIQNLEIAAGWRDGGHSGESHQDSNLFKVIEGAAYCLALSPAENPAACVSLDDLIGKIAAAQEPDGYFNTYYTAHKHEEKYLDLHRSHELYCAGHLLEAAVAHHEATGKRSLLDVAIRLADHLDRTFGPGKRETVPGHQELELALVRLYKTTGEKRYLELCRYFVDRRGDRQRVRDEYAGKPVIESERHPGRNRPPEYRQDHLPAVEQREPIGHAVRAGYFYAAMADVALECDSSDHARAADALWENLVGKHLYITGGVGTHQHHDEGFGDDYRLPNETAYCETCGGIALALFTHRMNLLHGDARYADVIETIFYNHLLSCTDLAGVNFNYRNPLASDGSRRRHPWSAPACCPTNIVRIVPQFARFVYAVGGDALYVDQFVSSTADLVLDSGKVRLTQETHYPWDGRITITVQPEAPREIALHIRIPGWVEGRPVPSDLYAAHDEPGAASAITVNGVLMDTDPRTGGYGVIKRTWQPGDRLVLDLPMPVRRVHAHKKMEANRGRVALMRGPLLYCLEGTDHDIDLDDITIADDIRLTAQHQPDLLGGVTVIRNETGSLTAIPYYAWNNREPGKMAVWIRSQSLTAPS